jgi:sterol 3beta-glucosyltransferase
MMRNPFSARKHLHKLIYPMMYNSLVTFYSVARENDRVLFHVKAMADYFAEQCPGKLIRTNVVPAIEPTREFINPLISFAGLPSFLNRVSYKLTDLGMKMMSKPINRFRQHAGITGKYRKPQLLSIYGLSPLFLPQPKDYPVNTHFTGFWLDVSSEELEKDIIDFISKGEPPLLITFGSMPFESKINFPKVLNRLTKELKTRLIIVKGWGMSDTDELEKNSSIKVIESAPYDKLFPHIKAAVHHGGIGTVAACLKAGKPFLTCPVLYPLGDQHFWGAVANRKGVGLKPLPLKKMKEDILIKTVKELLTKERLYINSKQLMEEMKYEDGVANAIDLIEKL